MDKNSQHKHTYVTSSEKRRRAKQGKAKKALSVVLCIILFAGMIVLGVDRLITSRYTKGDGIDNDIRTADELKDDVVNILVCGLDYEEDRTAAMTDVIMYVTLNVKDKTVSAFQIPRDTYIGSDVATGGSGKVNGVYWHGPDKDNKINNLARALYDKLGLTVDHYVTLDMDAFVAMVDGIDYGLDMYVPCPIITKEGRVIIDKAGWYKVSGETAQRIVRNRNYPNADVQRLEVQTYFYAALVKYFTENLDTSDFIKIMNRFTQYITTDMHWTRIASLAQFGFSVRYEDMRIVKPALHGYDVIKPGSENAMNIMVRDVNNWAQLLNEYSRPYQNEVGARSLSIPANPPRGEISRDYGVTRRSIQSIGDILANSPEE